MTERTKTENATDASAVGLELQAPLSTRDEIAQLGELLRKLEATDPQRRVFGSKEHHYRLGPVLSEEALTMFESTHGIKLPEDYRCFLATVGHGGAGPFYGLEALKGSGVNLSKPFSVEWTVERERQELEEDDDFDDLPHWKLFGGVLQLCHQGSAILSYLVVNGPTYGTIWSARELFYHTGLTFSVWYRRWLERALLALENERLVPLLRVGMSRADVLAAVGGNWEARPAEDPPGWWFEGDDIPAQLLLDDHEVVVKIIPWDFITARPR